MEEIVRYVFIAVFLIFVGLIIWKGKLRLNQASQQPEKKNILYIYPAWLKPAQRIAGVILILGFVLFILLSSGKTDNNAQISNRTVYEYAKETVISKLKAPATAQFPARDMVKITNLSSNNWQITGYVDSQNAFGALIRTYYECDIKVNQVTQTFSGSVIFVE